MSKESLHQEWLKAKKPEFVTDVKYNEQEDAVFKKYANTTSPLNIRKATRSTLAPYTGAWTRKEAIHLLNRTMFGAKPADVATALSSSVAAAVSDLVYNVPNPFPDCYNWYENTYADTTGVALGSSWINATYGDGTINYYRTIGLQGTWIKNMVNQNFSLQEKMTLFLSSLVPVAYSAVGDCRFLYRYTKLVSHYALGNYKNFLKAVTKDGAMLYFLNGYINNKYSPDENYARELQELFSVGKFGGQQFAEDDVREAAKVLTGWRIDDVAITTNFDNNYHDTGNKIFSAFYNNTVITGQSGPTAGDTELDALLTMILSGQSAQVSAKYICRKLYRFFVYYDIDANIEANIIAPLATTFINSNWDFKPVLQQLFGSEHFFEVQSQGCYIRTPLDMCIGLIRTMNVQPDPATTFEDDHWLYVRHFYNCNDMGMAPGEVPNVSGFKSYYQSPQWHQLFINSNSLPKRMRWTDNLLTNYGHYVNGTTSFKADLPAFAASLSNPADPDVLLQDIVAYLFGVPVSATKYAYFKGILMNGQTNNSYWTTAWNDYLSNPTDPNFLNVVSNRLRLTITQMLRMAEHQLC